MRTNTLSFCQYVQKLMLSIFRREVDLLTFPMFIRSVMAPLLDSFSFIKLKGDAIFQ